MTLPEVLDVDAWHLDAIVDAGPLDLPWQDDVGPVDLHGRPGPALAQALAVTTPATLAEPDAIAYLRATEALIGWATALQHDALVAIAGSRPRTDSYELPDARVLSLEDSARSEIAAATRWSEAWAHDRLTTARLLNGPLRSTQNALRAGRLMPRQADVIAAAGQRMSGYAAWRDTSAMGAEPGAEHQTDLTFGRQCAELEDAILPTALRRGLAATRRAGERALLRLDAAHARRRREQERRTRDVYVVEEPDGMALLIARLGVEQAHACLTAVNERAHDPQAARCASTPDDARIGEKRADALMGALVGSPGTPMPGGSRPIVRTHVDVVIDLATLTGLADNPVVLRGRARGRGTPLAADLTRQLISADPTATMRRMVTDPLTGALLDQGRRRYAIPEALRRLIAARDGVCRIPGCGVPAAGADIDHAEPWEAGGPSDRANLGALCRRHHQMKTRAGWTITASDVSGGVTWRSPAGLEYDVPPPDLLAPD